MKILQKDSLTDIRLNEAREEDKIPFISLFSGSMGLDIGLEKNGFEGIVCNEIDKASIKTIKTNKPTLPVIERSVEEIGVNKINEKVGFDVKNIPLIVGGPPCQAFSVFGKRGGVKDDRGKLIYEFIRLVDEIKPLTFLMENVRGLHSMPIIPKSAAKKAGKEYPEHKTQKGSLLKKIIGMFEDSGYRVDCYLVNVVNYGAPQIRERLICIGNRFGLKSHFPQPEYSNRPPDNLPPFRTLGDVIGNGFVDPDPDLMNFSPRKLHYLSMVPPGGNWRSLPEEIQKESMGKSWYLKGGRSAYWRKLSFEFPSPTVVTMPNHAGTSMCHPTELRALTAGECAAIQEFPKDWVFEGSPSEKYRQIGNAVPIRLGEVAGDVIKKLLRSIENEEYLDSKKQVKGSSIVHIRPHVRTKSYWKNGKAYAGDHSYYDAEGVQEQLSLFDTE